MIPEKEKNISYISDGDVVIIKEEYETKGNDADTYMYKGGKLFIILPLGEIKAEPNPGILVTKPLIKIMSRKTK